MAASCALRSCSSSSGLRVRVRMSVSGALPSGPWARVHLGGSRQSLRVDVFPDVRQFVVSNCYGEDPMVLERPIRGFDFPPSETDDQNPVSLRHEFGGAG